MKLALRLQLLAIAAAIFLSIAPASLHAQVTYTYTGNTFNLFAGAIACPLDCGVNVSISLSQPLPANSDCPAFGSEFFKA